MSVTSITNSSQLALSVERARAELARCVNVNTVLELRDKATAIANYQRARAAGEAAHLDAWEVVIWSERRLGELLLAMPKASGGQPYQATGCKMKPVAPTLRELGFEKTEAYRYQQLAEIDLDVVENALAKQRLARRPSRAAILAPLKRQQRVERIVEIARGNADLDMPQRYAVIYADPPWRYEHVKTESRAVENQYPTMSLDDICALPLADIATDDAILFLWGTSPKLAEAMLVIDEWGFAYRTCMVWVKDKIGMGYYARQRHELLLIATRGQPPSPLPAARPDSVLEAPRTKHSAKPREMAERIERMYPVLPRIELFCRTPRDGWAVWGNQA